MACHTCDNPSLFTTCTACFRAGREKVDNNKMNLLARHTTKFVNRDIARQAQTSALDESLRLGQFWMKMAQTWKGGPDEKVYRARGYAFLARACELEQKIEIAYNPIDSISDMPRRVMIHRRAL